MPLVSRLFSAALVLCALAGSATAQCTGRWFATDGVSGPSSSVGALTAWDPDGAGPLQKVLVVGGTFNSAGATPANNIATWNGTGWSTLGAGIDGEVDALAVLPNGRLVAAGTFASAGGRPVANIAQWDGTNWSPLADGLNNTVWALNVTPAGELIAGGMFTSSGATAVNRVARWNGSAWTSLGTGTANGVGGIVYAVASYGNNIYVGGGFTAAGGVANRRYIAKWDGAAWSTLSGGMNWTVLSLATLANGDVVAGGTFTFPANRVARWDGTGWYPMESGTNAQPLAFYVMPNGDLIAGGHFVFAGSQAASKIARWDGFAWSAMGLGMDNYVIGLALMPDGNLYAGGGFTLVDNMPSPGLARWSVCHADFNCDGSVDFFDYLDFAAAFDAESSQADFNADGTIDFFDYLDFVQAFDAGCGQ